MRQVLAAADAGNTRAQLARDLFVRRIVGSVGAMVATLGGLDALVFTGGIGEHRSPIRAAVRVTELSPSRADTQASMDPAGDRDISASDSQVRVLVISAREDLSILRHVMRVLDWTCPRSRPSPDVSVAANDLVGCPSDTVLSTGVDSPVSAASSDRRLSDAR